MSSADLVDRDNPISSHRPASSLPEIHPAKILDDDNDVSLAFGRRESMW